MFAFVMVSSSFTKCIFTLITFGVNIVFVSSKRNEQTHCFVIELGSARYCWCLLLSVILFANQNFLDDFFLSWGNGRFIGFVQLIF